MSSILNKRILRDLKTNFMRYFALLLLIIMGMFIVVSIVASSETVIIGTTQKSIENNVEDGEFSVFIPLTEEQENELSNNGVTIEKMFNFDVEVNDTVIRVMKIREKINFIELSEGELAKNNNEVVLEQRYCDENNIKLGDTINIADVTFKVVGIGSTPDYDMPIRKISDSSVESSIFGLAFVTSNQYDKFIEQSSQKAQDYCYSYRLNGKITDDELKQLIKNLDFDYHDVDDTYFQDYISDTIGKKDSLLDGIQELVNGSIELNDGIVEIDEHSDDLNNSAKKIFNQFLAQATTSLQTMGITETLTADNYSSILDDYISKTDSEDLKSLKNTLNNINSFVSGTIDYTTGVKNIYDGSVELSEGIIELQDETNNLIDDFFELDIDNLTMFLKASDNPRILAASNERTVNKSLGLIAGIIVMILFTYVISVFIIHQIQSESSIIGTLYALGVKKKNLIVHYITLPTIISFIGGIIGSFIGFSDFAINLQMNEVYSYYSIPKLETILPIYLIIYSIVMPPIISIIVNYFVISKKLSQTALSLIKNERKESAYNKITLNNNMGFISNFQIRQILRELRIAFTVIFGMFISLLIFMIGLNSVTLCTNVKNETQADTKYEYMYYLKYPKNELPKEGEPVYSQTLSKEYLGYNLDINIFGIDDDNKYFNVETVDGKNNIVISKSVQQKYKLNVGDKFILSDNAEEIDYVFSVKGVADYSAGLVVFMDIDSMRELFNQDDDYYNTIFSDKELNIEEGRLYSITTKEDIYRSSEVFLNMMRPTQIMMVSVSIVIFCVVMYLMMKVMLDRSAFGISLVKIFGFHMNEIKKLYINGNMFVVVIGALICIPCTKLIADQIYPNIVSNTACGVNIVFPWYVYPCIFLGIMIMYFVISTLLIGKLKKISPAEVLKNRE